MDICTRFSRFCAEHLHLLRFSSFESREASDPSNAALNDCVFGCLVKHCCTILLNRIFLPVPVVRVNSTPSNTKTVTMVFFPDAPQLFLTDRLNALTSAAKAVSIICRQAIRTGFPPVRIPRTRSSKMLVVVTY